MAAIVVKMANILNAFTTWFKESKAFLIKFATEKVLYAGSQDIPIAGTTLVFELFVCITLLFLLNEF